MSLVCLAFAGYAAYLALELPWSDSAFGRSPIAVGIGLGFLVVAVLALVLIFQGNGVPAALLVLLSLFVGTAQCFVFRFRAAGITPLDLMAIGTATEVAGKYDFSLSNSFGFAALACAAGITALGLMRFYWTANRDSSLSEPAQADRALQDALDEKRRTTIGRTVQTLAGLGLAAILVVFVHIVPLYETYGIDLPPWNNVEAYQKQGFIPTFISGYQKMGLPVPEAYSPDKAEALLQTSAAAYDAQASRSSQATQQFSTEQPNVVVVMNESFADISNIVGKGSSYTGPEFFTSEIEGLVSRGNVYVSVFGGGTCNTEFEVLTCNSMHFIGADKYPYTLYDMRLCDNLVKQFKRFGYQATAIHPANAKNYSRDLVYPALGFDDFISFEDFVDPEPFHGNVRDRDTYKQILKLIEQSDEPQFVFDVTIHNHGPYDGEYVPDEIMEHYSFEGIDDATYTLNLNDYISSIKISDEDLEEFVGELSKLDEKVVLLFFGDHQANLLTQALDVYYPDLSQTARWELAGRASYLMWANYELESVDYEHVPDQTLSAEISSSALGAHLAELVGLPLSEFQKAVLYARSYTPAFSQFGYLDAGGAWHGYDEAVTSAEAQAALQAIGDLETIQYLHFSSKQ